MFEDVNDGLRKISKRMTLANNMFQGKLAEDLFVLSETSKGNKVERTGRGSDFKVTKRDIITGKSGGSRLVEVKSSSTAPVSKLQQKTLKKHNGKVVRSRFW